MEFSQANWFKEFSKVNWRYYARRLSYLDLVLTAIIVVFAGLAFIFHFGFSPVALVVDNRDCGGNVNNGTSQFNPSPNAEVVLTRAVPLIWLLAGLGIGVATIQVLAAVRLINSTSPGRHPLDALQLAKFWRTVTIIFTGINWFVAVWISVWIDGLLMGIALFHAGFRVIWAIHVKGFMIELEIEAAREAAPGEESKLATPESQV